MLVCGQLPDSLGLIKFIPAIIVVGNTVMLYKYVTEIIRRVVTSYRARRSANLLILWLTLSYLLIVPTVIASD